MFRLISIFGFLLFFTLFSSCKNENDYNQRANELIQKVIVDKEYSCILNIGELSIIEMGNQDNPSVDIRKRVIEYLHLRDNKELDSLENLSENFILDTVYLKEKNIKVIQSLDYYKALSKYPNKYLKICPNGCLNILRPIFDKEYKTAVIYFYDSVVIEIYKFENGKWQRK